MVYGQVCGASSLRVIEQGFNAQRQHHYHLGCGRVHRSTLADANARAVWPVFSQIAQVLMQRAQRSVRQEAQAFLHLIDSTSITLKGPGFDEWTQARRTRNTQGVKLHVLFGLTQQAPLSQCITLANVNDIEYARELTLERGVIYVFDKAYCNYSWWWRIEQSGAKFVTRFKCNTRLEVLSERAIARSARGVILKDQLVRLSNKNPGAGRRNPYSKALRRIEVAREDKTPLVLATNDLKSSAIHIAQRYKARWQIELFFKWIKQHLRIKGLLGRSENAVRAQLLSALIAYLLCLLDAKQKKVKTTLWLHMSELRATLFQRPQTEWARHRRWREQKTHFERHQAGLFA
jgi:IS4 transposase